MSSSRSERYESDIVNQAILGDFLELPTSKLMAKSRFLKAPMSEQLASWDQHDVTKRGMPNERLVRLYEAWGKGGFGIILTGNVIITPIDLEAPGNMIMYEPFETPELLEAFSRIATAAKAHGSLAIVQLSHGGRQVTEAVNPNPVSASDVQLLPTFGMTFGKPTPLTKDGIKDIVNKFAYAAEFSHRAGFDGVELHGAHGYLIAQFLASSSNKRTDEYGGSLQNRARFVYEIVEAIRARVKEPKFSIGIKINSAEFQKGGFQPEECRDVCAHLEELGIDFVELSGGTYEDLGMQMRRESSAKREAFFLNFADVIRPALKKAKLYVSGGFRTASGMVRAIESGSTDGIGLGRPVCEEPDLPAKLISGEVSSARNTLIDASDFGLSNAAAGAQINQIALSKTPFSTADQKNVDRFLAVMGEFMQRMQENAQKGIIEAGFATMPDDENND